MAEPKSVAKRILPTITWLDKHYQDSTRWWFWAFSPFRALGVLMFNTVTEGDVGPDVLFERKIFWVPVLAIKVGKSAPAAGPGIRKGGPQLQATPPSLGKGMRDK